MLKPDPVRPGQPVFADLFNRVMDAAFDQPQNRTGAGLSATGPGLTITRLLERTGFVPARITAVTAIGSPPRIQDVRYSVVALYSPAAILTNHEPRWRLFATGPAVIPAEVGDLCFMIRAPEGDGVRSVTLWVPTERLIGTECTSGGGGTTQPPPPEPIQEELPLAQAGGPESVTFQPPIGGLPQ